MGLPVEVLILVVMEDSLGRPCISLVIMVVGLNPCCNGR